MDSEEKNTENLEDNVGNVVTVETIMWAAPTAEASLPATLQCGQDHEPLRFQCQSQPSQDQHPYPDYLMYPQSQQFTRIMHHPMLQGSVHNSWKLKTSHFCMASMLTRHVTHRHVWDALDLQDPDPANIQQLQLPFCSFSGAEGSGQSGATSWFTTESILCRMMPGEVQPSEANICVAFTMGHPHFEESSLDSNHLTHPLLYNGNQRGQVLLMNSDPGPVFVTLENAPVHGNNSVCRGEVVATLPLDCGADPKLELLNAGPNASSNYRDFLFWGDHNQDACPSETRKPTVDRRRQTSVSRTGRTSCAPRSHKPCHCTKSTCLKLYCECFAGGVMCNNCNCTNCHNNLEHDTKRGKAIKLCLVRNADAFRPKISEGKSGAAKGWHSKGCNCKRSGCLKNYCECYEANIRCTPSCKCLGCRNYDVDLADKTFNENNKGRGCVSVITPAVVETVVSCLLARAEEAEREQRCETWAQHVVLNEFGHCFTQIVNAMF